MLVGTEAKNYDCPDHIGTVGRPVSIRGKSYSVSIHEKPWGVSIRGIDYSVSIHE